jgi:hypothetical protein
MFCVIPRAWISGRIEISATRNTAAQRGYASPVAAISEGDLRELTLRLQVSLEMIDEAHYWWPE